MIDKNVLENLKWKKTRLQTSIAKDETELYLCIQEIGFIMGKISNDKK